MKIKGRFLLSSICVHIPVILTHHSGDIDPPKMNESKS
jgi:hypothetical protein